MPIYEFECTACQEIFEVLVPRPTEKTEACPVCGSEKTRKLLSAAAGIIAKQDSSPVCPLSGASCRGVSGRGGCPRLHPDVGGAGPV